MASGRSSASSSSMRATKPGSFAIGNRWRRSVQYSPADSGLGSAATMVAPSPLSRSERMMPWPRTAPAPVTRTFMGRSSSHNARATTARCAGKARVQAVMSAIELARTYGARGLVRRSVHEALVRSGALARLDVEPAEGATTAEPACRRSARGPGRAGARTGGGPARGRSGSRHPGRTLPVLRRRHRRRAVAAALAPSRPYRRRLATRPALDGVRPHAARGRRHQVDVGAGAFPLRVVVSPRLGRHRRPPLRRRDLARAARLAAHNPVGGAQAGSAPRSFRCVVSRSCSPPAPLRPRASRPRTSWCAWVACSTPLPTGSIARWGTRCRSATTTP